MRVDVRQGKGLTNQHELSHNGARVRSIGQVSPLAE